MLRPLPSLAASKTMTGEGLTRAVVGSLDRPTGPAPCCQGPPFLISQENHDRVQSYFAGSGFNFAE